MKKTVKKRAFISSIAMLIVSAIVLTSSTFAWFSISKEANVESMNLNITTADGISISANTKKFGTTVTLSDIIPESGSEGQGLAAEVGHTNAIPDPLAPVSTDMALVSGYPVFYKGSVPETAQGATPQVSLIKCDNDYSGPFVVFDLFVQVSKNTEVKLKGTKITSEDENIVKAMRVAYVNCGSVDFANRANAKSLTTTQKADTAMWIADGNASDTTTYIQSDAGTRMVTKDADNPIAKNYVKSTSAGNVAKTADASDFSFFAKEGVNRIRFYVWVEGNDVDCGNDVAGGSFNFDLKLSID